MEITWVFYKNASYSKGGYQIFIFDKYIEIAKHFWTKLFDNYLLRAYYVSAISVNASQDRKENLYAKTIGSILGAMAETQASETCFHVGSLLLIHCHTALLYLNATLTSFHYLHCKHSQNSECAADTLSACWAYYQHKWQHYLAQKSDQTGDPNNGHQ